MTEQKIPASLNELNIGKIVKVQVFRRKDKDTIDTDTLEKYVGVLEAFAFDHISIVVKIAGLPSISTSRARQLVEVYI